MALAIALPILVLCLLRDISKMSKMAVFGFISLCIYVVFIIYIFIENLAKGISEEGWK